MGFALIIAGLFFLLDPSIVIIDILPDFIGYFLIILGMNRLSVLNSSMSDAKGYVCRLFAVSLVKVPCALIYITEASSPKQSWGLLFAMIFGFVETFYSLKAITAFFDALEDLSVSDDRVSTSTPALARQSQTRAMCIVFAWASAILPALPELTTLTSSEYGVVTGNGILSLANYKTAFTVFAAIIGLVLGIYWFVVAARYIRGIKKDVVFYTALCEKVEHNELELRNTREIKAINGFLSLSFIGFLLCLEVKLDGINYLPHTLFASLFLIALIFFSKNYEKAKKAILPTAVYAGVSATSWGYTVWFILSFFGDFLNDSEEGLSFSMSSVLETYISKSFPMLYKFIGMCIASAVDALFFTIFLWMLRKLFLAIISDHAGGTYTADGHLIGERELEATQRSLRKNTDLLFIIGTISALSGVVATALTTIFPGWWMADAAIRLAFVAVGLKLVYSLKDALKDRYQIERQ